MFISWIERDGNRNKGLEQTNCVHPADSDRPGIQSKSICGQSESVGSWSDEWRCCAAAMLTPQIQTGPDWKREIICGCSESVGSWSDEWRCCAAAMFTPQIQSGPGLEKRSNLWLL